MRKLRVFSSDHEPSELRVRDTVHEMVGGGNWEIVGRFTTFPLFVLKNGLTGDAILATPKKDRYLGWQLVESVPPMQEDEVRRMEQQYKLRKAA